MGRGGKKKSSEKDGGGDRDFLKREDKLQAVLLADSFATTLRPVTFERPKVLLPLVNVPMLNYTLEFLVQGGVKQVFVVCCAHAQQVASFLRESPWTKRSSDLSVEVIVLGDNVFSTGDALRHLDDLQVIQNDFVLISGDVISNIRLDRVVKEHKARARKDKRNFMTMIVKKAAPTHRTRSMDDDVVMAVAEPSNQLLMYEDRVCDRDIAVDTSMLLEHDALALRYDLMDCHIDICTPEVLTLFTDNFDYQDLRNDFLRGVLGSEILGNRVFVHSIRGEYAARVKDFRTYDSVSRDIIHRWTYPMVPDNNMTGETSYRLARGNIYREDAPDGSDRRVFVARSATVGRETVIGAATEVGDGARVERSVVGRGCRVGKNAVVRDSYLFDGCVIEDGAVVERSMVCAGAVVRAGAHVGPGAVLSFGVVAGAGVRVPPYARFTTHEGSGDDDDLSDGGAAAAAAEALASRDRRHSETSHGSLRDNSGALGEDGAGRLYVEHADSDSDDEDELGPGGLSRAQLAERFHFNSLAPDVAGYAAASSEWYDEERKKVLAEFESEEAGASDSDDDAAAARGWDQAEVARQRFQRELHDTIGRGHKESLPVDAIQLEAASLKLSYDATFVEYSHGVALALCSFVDPAPVAGDGGAPAAIARPQLLSLRRVLKKWGLLLSKFGTDQNEQRKMIHGIEAMCVEHPLTYGPLFGYLLQFLYDDDVLGEEAILEWHGERERTRGADGLSEAETAVLGHANRFLDWLREADEASSDDDSDSSGSDDSDSSGSD